MYQYDHSTAVASRPARAAAGTAGWFTDGNAATSSPSTILVSDFMNMLQAELLALLTAAGVTPDKTADNQILAAVQAIFNTGVTPSTTGDIKVTIKTAADTGWVMMNDGTIGDASSAATTRANADCQTLFALLWNNVSDTYAPVAGGRGASAAADWAAHKKIKLLSALGRAIGLSGTGATLTARALGATVGEETHLLVTSEMPSHHHGVDKAASSNNSSGTSVTPANTGGVTQNTTDVGGDTAHNNMQPTVFLNAMIKL